MRHLLIRTVLLITIPMLASNCLAQSGPIVVHPTDPDAQFIMGEPSALIATLHGRWEQCQEDQAYTAYQVATLKLELAQRDADVNVLLDVIEAYKKQAKNLKHSCGKRCK